MAKFTCNFISYTLMRTVDISVIIPSVTIPEALGVSAETKKVEVRHTKKNLYPVLYLLHGMGNNHMQWNAYTNIELFAEERNIAVVSISAENKSYINIGGEKFYDFLDKELPDFICGMFPVSTRSEDTYIAGLSMGGCGALVHALSNPDKYRAVGAFSAALGMNPAELLGLDQELAPEYNPEILADKLIQDDRRFPSVYLACGQKDFLLNVNKMFYNKLKGADIEVTWDNLEEYGHEWRFWNIEIERFLSWIEAYRTDVYVGSKRQI